MDSRNDLERELDALTQKAGLLIPRDRKAGVVAAYAQLKQHVSMVREALAAGVSRPDTASRSQ